jgi:hypothetical protein
MVTTQDPIIFAGVSDWSVDAAQDGPTMATSTSKQTIFFITTFVLL